MEPKVLIIEPFCGGSHKQLVALLEETIPGVVSFGMKPQKWHWRMRTSALYFSAVIPRTEHLRTLFASSVLNLAELVGLRPDLANLRKVLYFHENQLVYPVRKHQDRDFQYGYNQIVSCLVADVIVFNSRFNMNSFLSNIQSYLKLMPDYRPKDLADQIRPKCRVLYYPVDFPSYASSAVDETKLLHIVWPHRWEHDKDPDTFFSVLFQLQELDCAFNVSVIGQSYEEIPKIFSDARRKLDAHILTWGYQESVEDYYRVLQDADVAVSTAQHEFFGVAMLESAHFGCYPLCPNQLVYPEIFPEECIYRTIPQLVKKLKYFCRNPSACRNDRKPRINLKPFSWKTLKDSYIKLLH
ncbi:tRNA-queuosine alpha-mannosyltransferase-like [Oscarella lobularis]|uniref:tRNA-queuosine alpha-mannosyltransferase-like n=1 Tax=Oscarella lobularis TaxID=121494 RepID=UPI0033137779